MADHAEIMVQAIDDAYGQPQGPWQRVRITSSAPLSIRLSTWILGEPKTIEGKNPALGMAVTPSRLLFLMPATLTDSFLAYDTIRTTEEPIQKLSGAMLGATQACTK